jgi:HD-like signal output (HDOD) protein
MVSVLFVDSDVPAMESLCKTCGARSPGWQTVFAPNASAGRAILSSKPFDAVVVGTRLGEMDGASFLNLTKERCPETVRIALLDQGDPGGGMRSLPVAHQCLTKPCEPETLVRTIERSTELQALLHDNALRRMIGEVGDLPSLPSNLVALDSALSSEESSLGEVASIIGSDVAMSAKVLQLVNSAFFGVRAVIHDLRQAIAYLGIEMLRNLTTVTEAFRVFTPSPLLPDDWMARFNAHSLEVADIAGQLVGTSTARYEASVAGMLHGVGELVVAERAPAKLYTVRADVLAGRCADEAETEHLGATYPVLGAYLLSLWGTNYRIVEAVARHRESWSGPRRDPELADVVHVADCLASPCPKPQTMPWEGEDHPLAGGLLADGSLDGYGTHPGDVEPGDDGAASAAEAPAEVASEAQEACEVQICGSCRAAELSDDYLDRTGLLVPVRILRNAEAARHSTLAWTVS